MDILKQHIEELYLSAKHFNIPSGKFVEKILDMFGVDNAKQTRSQRQRRAKWMYLTLVAKELNKRGITYEPPPPSLGISLRWTKDLLYHMYWVMLVEQLFPDKKGQLNTSEYCMVVDHLMDLFSMCFDIQIPFPNLADFLRQKEIEEQQKAPNQ